jgi:hypothetical protein
MRMSNQYTCLERLCLAVPVLNIHNTRGIVRSFFRMLTYNNGSEAREAWSTRFDSIQTILRSLNAKWLPPPENLMTLTILKYSRCALSNMLRLKKPIKKSISKRVAKNMHHTSTPQLRRQLDLQQPPLAQPRPTPRPRPPRRRLRRPLRRLPRLRRLSSRPLPRLHRRRRVDAPPPAPGHRHRPRLSAGAGGPLESVPGPVRVHPSGDINDVPFPRMPPAPSRSLAIRLRGRAGLRHAAAAGPRLQGPQARREHVGGGENRPARPSGRRRRRHRRRRRVRGAAEPGGRGHPSPAPPEPVRGDGLPVARVGGLRHGPAGGPGPGREACPSTGERMKPVLVLDMECQ